MTNSVASPCIRNCCLDQQDVCIGCYRHIDEIVGWGNRSDDEKLIILKRCENRKIAHTQNKRNRNSNQSGS